MVSQRLDTAYVPDIVPDSDIEYFDRAGHGARIGWGESPALLVVDMTETFTRERAEEGDRAVAATMDLLAVARDVDIPVIYTRPDETLPGEYPPAVKPTADDAPGLEWHNVIDSRLEPRSDELVIQKPRASAFFDTHLAAILHEWGVDTVLVLGMTTSGCVRASAVDAHSNNFNTIVPRECTADRSRISHEVSLFDIDMKYGDVTPVDEVIARLETYRDSPNSE